MSSGYVTYTVTAPEWFDGGPATVTRGVLLTAAGQSFPVFYSSRLTRPAPPPFTAVFWRGHQVSELVLDTIADAAALLIEGADRGACVALHIKDASGRTVLDCDSQQWLRVLDVHDAGVEAMWTDPTWWEQVTT